jgi:hypothetical protein
MLTNKEIEQLKRNHARERERLQEAADREARGRTVALRNAKKQAKSRLKEKERRAAVAKASGKKQKSMRRSVYTVSGGAFETDRRKF